MTNKNLFLIFLTALFFLISPLWAQSGHYVIEQHYVHQIIWVGDKYALKYEVLVERNEGKGYRSYLREFTELSAFQLSVPPGNYRYRITPYDYLEQPGEASAWINIDIKPIAIAPIEVQKTDDGSYVLHSHDKKPIIPGVDEVIIKNPNELDKKDGVLVVDKQAAAPPSEDGKPINFYLNAAWASLIPVYGGVQQIFGYDFYPAGVMVRFGLLFNTVEWFNPGLELSTSWYMLNKDINNEDIVIQAGVTGLNFVARKHLPDQSMALTLRAGCALAFQIGEITAKGYLFSNGGMALQLNLELSFLWFAFKHFYLETGVGFNHLLFKDNYSGCLRPWLGIGWQF